MNRLRLFLFFMIAVGAAFAREPATTGDKNIDSIVREGNALALQLYSLLKVEKENTVFSPYGIYESMALPYAGAQGATESQMSRLLRFKMAKSFVNAAYRSLEGRFNIQSSYNHMSGIWLQKGAINPPYRETVEKDYGAALRLVDYVARPEGVRLEMNNWMREKTQGRIAEIVPPQELVSTARMVVLSGAYVKGRWAQTFDLRQTKQAPFFFDRYTTSTVPTMFATGEYNHLEDEHFSLIELPYESKRNEATKLSLLIFLPHDTYGLDRVEKSLNLENMEKWLATMEKKWVVLSLPRFRLADSFSLANTFKSMGLTSPFKPDADFSGIREGGELSLSNVYHKASFSADEWGSEGGISLEGAPGPQGAAQRAVGFTVNQPFMFMVIDRETNAILMMGRVLSPRF